MRYQNLQSIRADRSRALKDQHGSGPPVEDGNNPSPSTNASDDCSLFSPKKQLLEEVTGQVMGRVMEQVTRFLEERQNIGDVRDVRQSNNTTIPITFAPFPTNREGPMDKTIFEENIRGCQQLSWKLSIERESLHESNVDPFPSQVQEVHPGIWKGPR